MARFPTGVVVVGGSAAGLSTADGLREGGYDGSIMVLDENLEPGFDRPMLSKGLLATDAPKEPVTLRTPERLAAQDITVLPGHRAVGLDIDRRIVVTSYGEAIPWEHIVIATGVDARPLHTTSGTALPTLRTLADLAAVRSMVERHQAVTVVGGGFIGLEVAAALRPRGIDVKVLCPNDLPLVRHLGADVSAWLRDLHRARGVDLELGVTVASVNETSEGYTLRLTDGTTREAYAVLAGIGAEAATEWLIGSGVELDGGIVTDLAGRTNVPGVWAAGDVACRPDRVSGGHRRFEHWTHAIEQGHCVGLNIARSEQAPFDAVPYVWTEQFGRTLHLFGERRPDDQDTLVAGSLESGEFVVVHGNADGFHAVTASGHLRSIRTYRKLLRAGASLADALAVPTS